LRRFIVLLFILAATPSLLAALPGFKLLKIADATGFITSLTLNSKGEIYYSVRDGEIYALSGSKSVLITKLETANSGNEALLGIAFRSDHELLAHHVLVDETGDVISSVELPSAEVTEVARFICDGGRVCGNEHHGGNITVAHDGYAYFAIGDYGGNVVSQNPDSPGGKVFRISPQNDVLRFALGFRNPFDMVYDGASGALLVGDNGPIGGDELHLIHAGDNAGWPLTYGFQDPVPGMVPPVFVFQGTTAPTGMTLLNGRGFFRSGMLVGGFVTKALHYFPDALAPRFGYQIFSANDAGSVLDVVQAANGTIYFATGNAIFQLIPPRVGDCDGDGLVDARDNTALAHEILDGDGDSTFDAQKGGFRGSWGCDANQDALIDSRDLVMLTRLQGRNRPLVHP
jgi:glucose/arabinose dehydrogenase